MFIQKDLEPQVPEINKEEYLSRLPQTDRNQLVQVGQQFVRVLDEEKRQGELVVVGGSIRKPLPRKDIDLLIVLQPHHTDTTKDGSPEIYYAKRDFENFLRIVEKITQAIPSLNIDEIFEPAIDEEFNDPSILKTDGSIKVRSKTGNSTPIEFIRIRNRGSFQQVAMRRGYPFVILEHR